MIPLDREGRDNRQTPPPAPPPRPDIRGKGKIEQKHKIHENLFHKERKNKSYNIALLVILFFISTKIFIYIIHKNKILHKEMAKGKTKTVL